MIKNYITIALCAILGVGSQAMAASAPAVVVDEDFSLFTAGSEAQPDTEDITDKSVYEVPASYTKLPHWPGGGVYQAGGVCYLGVREVNGESLYGFISTPVMELYGTVTLTFRARLAEAGKGSMWFALCDNENGPIKYYYPELTSEWKTFEYVTDQASMNGVCNFQFSAENGYVFIDDIKVTRLKDRIPVPNVDYPHNISTTSFEAKWEPTLAPEHLLSVYYKALPENVETGTLKETFDGINATSDGKKINLSNPGYPEGWTIDVSSHGSRDLIREAGCFLSAPQAIVLDAEGDKIVSAETPLPVKRMRFWLRPSRIDNASWSMIAIRVIRTDGSTETLAQYNPSTTYMTPEGTLFEWDEEILRDGVVRMEIEYIQNDDDDIAFYIDDIELDYCTPMDCHFIVDHKPVQGNSYLVEGIDPQYEHYYFVQARDEGMLSAESDHMWVDGISGLKVKALPPSIIGSDSFTAEWEPLPNASDYTVTYNRVVSATDDMPGFTLLKEDFSGITTGELNNPGTSYEPQVNLAEEGMAQTGWVMTNPVWIKGMAGSFGTTWYGSAGLVAAPRISLDNGDGSFTVKCSFMPTIENDKIWVMLLHELNDSQAIVGIPLEGNAAYEVVNGVATFDAGTGLENVLVAFMSESGGAFFIDDVEIVQDLKKGDNITLPYGVAMSKTNSLRIGDLPTDSDYEYTVSAYRMKQFVPYRSLASDPIHVKLDPSSVEGVVAEGVSIRSVAGAVEVNVTEGVESVSIFDLQGRVIAAGEVSGTRAFPVSEGIYVVAAGPKRMKLVVK